MFEAQEEGKSTKQTYKLFRDANKDSVKKYMQQWRKIKKERDSRPFNVIEILVEIVRDVKTPGSTKVNALKLYKELIDKEPTLVEEENPMLKLLMTLEKEDVVKNSYGSPDFHLWKEKQELEETNDNHE